VDVLAGTYLFAVCISRLVNQTAPDFSSQLSAGNGAFFYDLELLPMTLTFELNLSVAK